MQTFSGFQYIKIDIANKFGLDKENWDTRLDWFEENKHSLMDMVDDADSPAQFYSAVNSYRNVLQGKPTGTPISLDATASGAQILCALTGDIEGGKLCNIVSTGNREDLYTNVYEYMVKNYNLSEGISREKVKKAIMTSLYGSEAEPFKVFGKKHINDFYETMNTLMRGGWALNALLLSMWRSDVDSYMWTLPDNFHASFKVMTEVKEEFVVNDKEYVSIYMEQGTAESGKAISANIVHSIDSYMVREITSRAMYNPKTIRKIKNLLAFTPNDFEEIRVGDNDMVRVLIGLYEKTGILSARIFDHINRQNIDWINRQALQKLLDTLPDKPFEVLSVHDCFNVLPNYGNDIRSLYREVMAEIADSNLLQHIMNEALEYTGTITKMKGDLGKLIRESEYALS